MARSIWKGSIAFGRVNIPVPLTSAESRNSKSLCLQSVRAWVSCMLVSVVD